MSKIFHEASGRHADHKTVTIAMEKDYPMEFFYSQVCGKRFGSKKSKGDMVKNY